MSSNSNININHTICCGHAFLSAMIKSHGIDKAWEMWNNMQESMPPDIYMGIFTRMLDGNNFDITFKIVNRSEQIIPTIKAIRAYTGMSLKDAKDICAKATVPTETGTVSVNDMYDYEKLKNTLLSLGCVIL